MRACRNGESGALLNCEDGVERQPLKMSPPVPASARTPASEGRPFKRPVPLAATTVATAWTALPLWPQVRLPDLFEVVPQLARTARVAQLTQGLHLDLADPFAGHVELLADLLPRSRRRPTRRRASSRRRSRSASNHPSRRSSNSPPTSWRPCWPRRSRTPRPSSRGRSSRAPPRTAGAPTNPAGHPDSTPPRRTAGNRRRSGR